MGFSISSPSYMFQTPSGYIFRLKVPPDLRPLVGKTEFRYSLRSGMLSVARIRAQAIASYIKQLFTRVRISMSEWTKDLINNTIREYIKETLANDETCRAMPPDPTGKA